MNRIGSRKSHELLILLSWERYLSRTYSGLGGRGVFLREMCFFPVANETVQLVW